MKIVLACVLVLSIYLVDQTHSKPWMGRFDYPSELNWAIVDANTQVLDVTKEEAQNMMSVINRNPTGHPILKGLLVVH